MINKVACCIEISALFTALCPSLCRSLACSHCCVCLSSAALSLSQLNDNEQKLIQARREKKFEKIMSACFWDALSFSSTSSRAGTANKQHTANEKKTLRGETFLLQPWCHIHHLSDKHWSLQWTTSLFAIEWRRRRTLAEGLLHWRK